MEDPIIEVQGIARNFANYYHLPIGTINVSFKSNLKSPGVVELSSSNDFFIELHSQHKDYPNSIASILAHEVTHIFLHKYKISFPEKKDNEILTDTAASFLGLGFYLLEGFNMEANIVRTIYFGYLTPDEVSYILALRKKVFGDDQRSKISSNFSYSALHTGWKYFESEFSKPPIDEFIFSFYNVKKIMYFLAKRRARNFMISSDSSKKLRGKTLGYEFALSDTLSVIFKCPICGQKLKVPAFGKRIKVHCPVCSIVLRCSP